MKENEKPVLGVCLAKIQDVTRSDLVRRICNEAKAQGCRVQIFNMYTDLYCGRSREIGEKSILNVIRMQKLSALILLSQTILNQEAVDEVVDQARQAGVPVISIDQQHEGCYNVLYEYEKPFSRVVRHVFQVHHCRRVAFIAGFKGNSFSEARVQVYRDALEEFGIPFDPKLLKYGDFWEYPAIAATKELLEDGIPEAIICANDSMAIAVCEVLSQKGIRVPEDVIVTGFDGIERELYHSPRLTTAAQDQPHCGKLAVETAMRLIRGEKLPPQDFYVHNEVRFSESCGCKKLDYHNSNHMLMQIYGEMEEAREFESWIFSMIAMLTDGHTLLEMPEYLQRYVMGMSVVYMQICLNAEFLRACDVDISADTQKDDMFVLAQREMTDYFRPLTRYSFQQQMSDPEKVYSYDLPVLFVPLHDQSDVFGYLIAVFDPDSFHHNRLYSFVMGMNQALSTIRSQSKLRSINRILSETNKELANMYIHDSMTGLLNRRGFFQELERRRAAYRDRQSWIYVASVDMDSLKYINDTYGHQEGDFAIKTVADAISACAGENGICARFGGDEYMAAIITEDPEEDGCRSFAQRLSSRLHSLNEQKLRPYQFGASCGTVLESITEDLDLDRLMKLADDRMYSEKLRRKCVRGEHREQRQ
ncbi:GGDEF domain-containing protein [uncultured Ruminococcus sp.]|uniref:substrate-binding and GGDEF domain-containing protein n=1 Tax=uncultured Ruminococcus sp. TaxID=165186 RepID=UPI0025EA260B|nr:GGDEF domain-containing protein [uncultured Ruminococcus sp.]